MNRLISFLFLALAAMLGAATAIGLPGFDNQNVVDTMNTASIKGDRRGFYELVRSDQERCLLRKGQRVGPETYLIENKVSCDNAIKTMSSALYWTDTAHGGVIISGPEGPLIEFAESDGPGFESVHPANPLFTLYREPG